MSPGATDRDATRKLPIVDARATDPDATRKLPPVPADIVDAEVAEPGDGAARTGPTEVLTGEIVLRDDPRPGSAEAEPAEGWLVDEALLPDRPPITSHRRAPGVTVPLILAAVVVLVGAVAWVAVGHLGRDVPPVTLGSPRAVDVGGPTGGGPSGSGATSGGVPQATAPPLGTGGAPRPTTAPVAPVPSSGAQPATSSVSPSVTSTSTREPLTTPEPVLVTTPTDGMLVRVVSVVSSQSMSVAGGSTDDGAAIVQSTATTPAEQWKLVGIIPSCFYLINELTGKALDEPGGSRSDGTQLQQWSYGVGNVNQMWCLRSLGNGQFSIQNIRSGLLLDLRDGGANGGVIQQWSGNPRQPDQNQTWLLVAAS